MYFVYMIKNSSNKLYIGITENPDSRLNYHNSKQGARFTRYVSDFEMVFLEQYEKIVDARRREIQIKKWRRDKKEFLIQKYNNKLPTKSDTGTSVVKNLTKNFRYASMSEQ